MDRLTLKWGSLKSWDIETPGAREILQEYFDSGVKASAILQKDTQEQKEIICRLIDACKLRWVYLDWPGKSVSKKEAKRYVMEYQRAP